MICRSFNSCCGIIHYLFCIKLSPLYDLAGGVKGLQEFILKKERIGNKIKKNNFQIKE